MGHSVTVKELQKLLLDLPDDALVVMSRDAEGNGHSPLANVWDGFYKADTTWFGSAYDQRDISECGLDVSMMVKAVVFSPTC